MKIFIKGLIALTIASLCEGCHVLYSNRIEKRHSEVRLSSWTVAISKHSFGFTTLQRDFIDYGSLIHPQAVFTMNSSVLYRPFANYKCLGGCGDFQNTALFSIRDCQIRDFARIFSGRLGKEEHPNHENNYAVIILNSPFDLGRKISVIHVPRYDVKSDYSHCYFYAATELTIINQNNYREKNVAIMAPYKAKLSDKHVKVSKCDGVNYTQIIEDIYLRVETSSLIGDKNYRGSPVVCQKNNTHEFTQMGFLNIFFHPKKPYAQQKSEKFFDVTYAHDSIYKLLDKYFKPTPF